MRAAILSNLLFVFAVSTAVQSQPVSLELADGLPIAMVWIPPGSFEMGTTIEKERTFAGDLLFSYEQPEHRVTLTRGFYLAQFELTQAQWTRVMGTQPWVGQRFVIENPHHPATYLTWEDAQALVKELNDRSDRKGFRLPTEAEWEYAARAGTTSLWSFGDDYMEAAFSHIWFRSNTANQDADYAHRVGQMLPNPWGLFDMHGNVAEWVQDFYDADYYQRSPAVDPQGPTTGELHITRGGSWADNVLFTRSAHRQRFKGAATVTGIRLVWQGADPPTAIEKVPWSTAKARAISPSYPLFEAP